ncbi:hypothetical protein GCM10011309_19620 [Litorimonas cladophorae]|uniref:Uncharacterized protein n=1 Tax=Litorimonas cladophorae TaxID=1220491 RepID=A0A918NIC5_9PROT|nr:hypothetical protein GCM10011309_19620 [Litorimonas cladophorae]
MDEPLALVLSGVLFILKTRNPFGAKIFCDLDPSKNVVLFLTLRLSTKIFSSRSPLTATVSGLKLKGQLNVVRGSGAKQS